MAAISLCPTNMHIKMASTLPVIASYEPSENKLLIRNFAIICSFLCVQVIQNLCS